MSSDRRTTGDASGELAGLLVDGVNVGELNRDELADLRNQKIGFVFQGFNLIPVATVAENVDYPLFIAGVPAAERRQRVAAQLEAVGLQDPGTGTPMKTDSIFRIYSMTKPVVSVAVMMLVERGQLLLSDPVSRWLPEYANQQVATANGLEPVKQEATVQDLLRHTAGLTYEFLGDSAVQRQYAQVKIASRERTNAEFSQTLAGVPLQFQPGSMWGYSRATDVLGRLVEVVSGQSLGAFLQTEIFDPLGMVDTGFAVPPEQHHRIAEPFAHDPTAACP